MKLKPKKMNSKSSLKYLISISLLLCGCNSPALSVEESKPINNLNVEPRLDCIRKERNGFYVAYFSHNNKSYKKEKVSIGEGNKVTPSPFDRGQLESFRPGESNVFPYSPFILLFKDEAQWTLGNKVITVNSKTKPICDLKKILVERTSNVKERWVSQTFEAKQNQVEFQFTTSIVDLKRRLVLSMNFDKKMDCCFQVFLNGQEIPHSYNNFESNELSIEIPNILKIGTNKIKVIFSNSEVQLKDIIFDGYIPPVYLPYAIHSLVTIPIELQRQMGIQKGLVKLKFLEGMKVRVSIVDDKIKFIDLDGLSLEPLNQLLYKLKIDEFYKIYQNRTSDEEDAREAEIEAGQERDVPNRNLFIALTFGEDRDVWEIIDEIDKLPYFEAVYPGF